MNNNIGDLLVQIKNGYQARREQITVPSTKFKKAVLTKLQAAGYIGEFEESGDVVKEMTIELIYPNEQPAVHGVKLVSTSGKRVYKTVNDMKPVKSGLGIAVLSTPQGILTNKEVKEKKVAGEVLFEIW